MLSLAKNGSVILRVLVTPNARENKILGNFMVY